MESKEPSRFSIGLGGSLFLEPVSQLQLLAPWGKLLSFLILCTEMCTRGTSFSLIEHVSPEPHQPQLRRQRLQIWRQWGAEVPWNLKVSDEMSLVGGDGWTPGIDVLVAGLSGRGYHWPWRHSLSCLGEEQEWTNLGYIFENQSISL